MSSGGDDALRTQSQGDGHAGAAKGAGGSVDDDGLPCFEPRRSQAAVGDEIAAERGPRWDLRLRERAQADCVLGGHAHLLGPGPIGYVPLQLETARVPCRQALQHDGRRVQRVAGADGRIAEDPVAQRELGRVLPDLDDAADTTVREDARRMDVHHDCARTSYGVRYLFDDQRRAQTLQDGCFHVRLMAHRLDARENWYHPRTRRLRMRSNTQSEIGDVLRSRRERIQPQTRHLPSVRRRTPGLRREEVAALAGIGVDWYIRLEQGRCVRPSDATIDALARALRLNAVERQHLRELAGATVRTSPAGAGTYLPGTAPPTRCSHSAGFRRTTATSSFTC